MASTIQDLKSQKTFGNAANRVQSDSDNLAGNVLAYGLYEPSSEFAISNKRRGIVDAYKSALGFYTKADEFADQLRLKQMEHDMQLETMEYENYYNSPTQVAARMRAAGLNPDLQGISGVESASAYNEPEVGLSVPQNTDPSFIDVASGIAGFASTLPALIKGGIDIAKGFQESKQSKLDTLVRTFEAVDKAFDMTDSSWPEKEVGDTISPASTFSILSLLQPAFGKKQAKKLASILDPMLKSKKESVQGKKSHYEGEKGVQQARRDWNELMASPAYSDDDQVQRSILSPIAEITFELAKQGFELQKDIYTVQQKYYKKLDGEKKAESENARYDAESARAGYDEKYWENAGALDAAQAFHEQNKFYKDYWSKRSGDDAAIADNEESELRAIMARYEKQCNGLMTEFTDRLWKDYKNGKMSAGVVLGIMHVAAPMYQNYVTGNASIASKILPAVL